MVRTRSIWLVCVALGALLSLIAVASASAFLPAGETALPGPGHAWTWQNPLPQGNALITVAVAGDHIAAAGGTAAVYHSADGGATWTAFGVDTNQSIPVVILDPTTDGQQGWMVTSNDQGGSFQSECWETKDSGATWGHLSDFAENAPVDTLFQLDASTLYAGGDDGYLVVSDDGGATWDDISIPMDESYSAFVSGIAFVDADRGWAATARIVYGTEDGGKTWTRVKEFDPDPQDKFFPRVSSIAATIQGEGDDALIDLYLTSTLGGAWQSMDAGASWDQCEIGGAKTTFKVSFLNPLYGIITGTSGKVWTTDDAGTEWVAADLPLEFNTYSAAWDPEERDGVRLRPGRHARPKRGRRTHLEQDRQRHAVDALRRDLQGPGHRLGRRRGRVHRRDVRRKDVDAAARREGRPRRPRRGRLPHVQARLGRGRQGHPPADDRCR